VDNVIHKVNPRAGKSFLDFPVCSGKLCYSAISKRLDFVPMKTTIFTIETPSKTREPVAVQIRDDRMWVKLQDLGDILGFKVDDWFKSKQGNLIIASAIKRGPSYDKDNNSTWAIESLALEFVRSFEDSEWLADKLLEIFNYEHQQIIDFSSSGHVRMMTDEQADRLRIALNTSIDPLLHLKPLILGNLPGMQNWQVETMLALEKQALHGPTGEPGTVYDGLAADVAKLRRYEVKKIVPESVTHIAKALMDCTPSIRAKLIEAKVNGDTRPILVIKADLEEMAKLDAESEALTDELVEPEGVEAIDRALKAIDAASRTLETVTEIARKAFKSFLEETDEPNDYYGVGESDRALSAEEIGAEMGLNEETVNVLLTHYDFQRRESLSQTYPNLCSYHPTAIGVAYCKQSLVIRCTAEPRFYYRPLWDRSLIEALQSKIDS
jgi:hypothetical protein